MISAILKSQFLVLSPYSSDGSTDCLIFSVTRIYVTD